MKIGSRVQGSDHGAFVITLSVSERQAVSQEVACHISMSKPLSLFDNAKVQKISMQNKTFQILFSIYFKC